MARTIVENLSRGINPLTGEMLSEEDACSNEAVQEALQIVLEHCTLDLSEKEPAPGINKELFPEWNGGFVRAVPKDTIKDRWTKQDEEYLRTLCQQKKSIAEIAHALNCSAEKICERLKML